VLMRSWSEDVSREGLCCLGAAEAVLAAAVITMA
jgi:hypothetical protein